MKKEQQYPENFRTLAGFASTPWMISFGGVLFSLFMQYLTDYSGIDSAIGKIGFAASFGSLFTLVSRVIDAIDDPLQAWIMDNAKESKFGKYRRFTLISIILCAVGVIMLFSMPQSVKGNVVLLTIWTYTGYIIAEIGMSFDGIPGILQKLTTDARIRTKLTSIIRMAMTVAAIPAMFFVSIATILNKSIGDMQRAYPLTCTIIVLIYLMISLFGIFCLKEPYRAEYKETKEKIRWRDIFAMLKNNKPLWIHQLAYALGSLGYALSKAVILYFLKWFYCANLLTGAVDATKYAAIYGTYATASLAPAFIAPLIAGIVVKKLGTIDRAMRVCMLITGSAHFIMYIFYHVGILELSHFIFIAVYLVEAIALTTAAIPVQLLNTEAADYAEYTTGRNMTASTTAVYNLITKTQNAVSTGILGVVLISIGYSVDASSGMYVGDITKLPMMIDGFVTIMALVPTIACICSWLMYKYLYPITPQIRAEMTNELERRHSL